MTKVPTLARARWLRDAGLRQVFDAIAAAGGEARVAGGAVRNGLMGLPVADIDLAATLLPAAVTQACEAAGLKVHPTGIDHGTVTVVAGGRPFEVTTLRQDVENFGRRARVSFSGDWRADAMRRDFTMNALYCDAAGKIYDYTNGYRDILRKRVIFVGDPGKRIREDYLRILRFFRFHAAFGRGSPDTAGLAACVRLSKGLETLSAERIRQELFKLAAAPGAASTLRLMARSGILARVLPFTENWRVFRRLPPDPVLRLAAIAAEPQDLARRLRLSNAEARRIEALLAGPAPVPGLRPPEQRAVLYRLGAERWRDQVRLAWARSPAPATDQAWRRLLALADRWTAPVFPVTGDDLIAAGLSPGPAIGQTLRNLEDWWIATGFKASKNELIQRLG